ncbi:unnamed protein product [Nezara viridula]|uniref:Uncharacterized protein n=1 Tax=Nezara viridula TaxID=85310 RepID=A0A9P0E8J9_NEZVI|nr:unnamed protein product [Nezara viridula]
MGNEDQPTEDKNQPMEDEVSPKEVNCITGKEEERSINLLVHQKIQMLINMLVL